MLHNKYLLTGSIMLFILVFLTFIGPFVPYVKEGIEGARVHFPEPGVIETAPFPPSADFPTGSDREGRNLLSVLVVGAKDTLMIIIFITVIRYFFGILLGMIASFKGRFISNLLYVWDQTFSSLPVIFFAVLFFNLPLLLFMENRFWVVIFSIALVEVGRVGVLMKDQILQIKNKPFIDAGVTIGMKPIGLSANYYLPNLLPSLVVNFCFDMGRVALIIGQLGILSIFVTQEFVQLASGYSEIRNTSFNWPTLLGEARKDIYTALWIPMNAAVAIMYLIFTFNILGEGLRRYFNKLTA
ncbi:ABC transporter permease [Sutcliffiella deserti]|uniref:ABC transporter permease n=1 Tax=Sutcliffiella deserti TaxID=2875501 RepID=UPI001CBEA938|nr:ABC transporter permease subunit [Sutcliffiella deserti]